MFLGLAEFQVGHPYFPAMTGRGMATSFSRQLPAQKENPPTVVEIQTDTVVFRPLRPSVQYNGIL